MQYELDKEKMKQFTASMDDVETPNLRDLDDSELLMIVGGIWLLEDKLTPKKEGTDEIKAEVVRRTRRWIMEQMMEEGLLRQTETNPDEEGKE